MLGKYGRILNIDDSLVSRDCFLVIGTVKFLLIDFSLHKEKRTRKSHRFNGSTKKEAGFQEKGKNSFDYGREQELFNDNISTAIAMLEKDIKQKLDIEYALIDSWFFCEPFLKSVLSLKPIVHIVGMVILAKAKYAYKAQD